VLEVDYQLVAAELERISANSDETVEEKIEKMKSWKKCQK
jgi:hypothetical protein